MIVFATPAAGTPLADDRSLVVIVHELSPMVPFSSVSPLHLRESAHSSSIFIFLGHRPRSLHHPPTTMSPVLSRFLLAACAVSSCTALQLPHVLRARPVVMAAATTSLEKCILDAKSEDEVQVCMSHRSRTTADARTIVHSSCIAGLALFHRSTRLLPLCSLSPGKPPPPPLPHRNAC